MQFLSCHAQQAEKQGETNASDSLPKFAYLVLSIPTLCDGKRFSSWKFRMLQELQNA